MTPTYDAYVDDVTKGTPDAPEKDLEPTPKAGDKYMNADVMLIRGGTISMVQVIECNFDDNGNYIGQANDNTIIDSHHYMVQFEDGEVNGITENILSESIYAMCELE